MNPALFRRRGPRSGGGVINGLFTDVTTVTGAAGTTHQLVVKYGVDFATGTDVTALASYSTANAAVATVDAPTLTGASTPSSITQGTGPTTYTWPCTNPRATQTLGGLPTGVTASSATVVDSTHISFALTATGAATVGNANVYLVDTPHGNSGTQVLAVAAASSGITALPTTNGAVLARWHAGAGTSTTTNAAGVSGWTDQTANGYVLPQATGANQPTYKTSGINGKPSIHFDGANFYFKMGAVTTALMPQNCIVFVIHKTASTSLGGQTLVSARDVAAFTGYRLGLDNTPHYQAKYFNGSTGITLTGGTPDTTAAHLQILKLDQSVATKQAIYVDSATALNGDSSTVLANTTQPFGVGADTSNAPAAWYSGDIGEIIVIAANGNDTNNTADITAIHGYAQTEWGVA